MYLDACKDLINNYFYSAWVKQFDFTDPTYLDTNKINFATYLKNFTSDFFTELNLSLLSGEYIIEKNILKKLMRLIL